MKVLMMLSDLSTIKREINASVPLIKSHAPEHPAAGEENVGGRKLTFALV